MKNIKLILFVLLISSGAQAQDTCAKKDSIILALKFKVVAAREALFNIQDYLNLCTANPKLNKFNPGWVQRALTDYFYKSGIVFQGRKKPVHKPVSKVVKKPSQK